MTENTSETENQDRSGKVRGEVQSVLTRMYGSLYDSFDKLSQTGTTGAEIVEALREIGEEEIRENYAAWAEIDIREDDATTLDPTVPDPVTATSYTNWEPKWVGPVTPLEDEFSAGDILRHLQDFPHSYVDQTGGGTATLVIRKKEGDVPITAGPGSYNWTDPKSSTFYVGEFYWGPDTYGVDGEEPTHPYANEPDEALDPENPGTLLVLTDRIRAAYAKCNPESAQ